VAQRGSEEEYHRRMNAVVDYIEHHLDQKLDLGTLARVAHFSPFHFHRLFGALMGEPLGDYLRRRRLEVAATRLRAQGRLSVLEVALGVGFGSAEAFTRAFRARFGCSPTQWRNRKTDQVRRKPHQDLRRAGRQHGVPKPEDTMNVKLVDRAPIPVVYLRRTGPYGPGIGRFWADTVAPWMATNDFFGRERYGISLDDPQVTRPERCRYDACIPSPEDEVVSGDPGRKIIPGGRYATLAYEGTSDRIGEAWDAILRDWLPKSGLQLDARPFFEHYPVDGRHDAKTGVFSCHICVPVADL
jgi:AraC family transcriptional regulator